MPAPPMAPASTRFALRWPVALILTAVVAAYSNSCYVPFLFDDTVAVLGNPTIRDLGSWAVLRGPPDGSATTGRPLVNLTLALNYAWNGADAWGYHVVNLALHGLAAITLFGLIRRSVARSTVADDLESRRLAFVVALLWAVHPLHTETVVTIAQRTELLCGALILLTLYSFACGRLAVAVVCCLAGMAAKEVMVVTPLVVLLYDRTFCAGSFAAAWRMRGRFYTALAATWLLLLWLLLQGGGSRGVAAGFGLGVSPLRYLLTQAEALTMYLRLGVWPHPLTLDYGTAVVSSLAEVVVPGLLVLTLLGGTIWALVRRPPLGFLGASFFLILAPSSSFVPLVTQTIAEHRMYLPLAAVITALVLSARSVFASCGGWVFGAMALALGVTTVARNEDYRDAIRIWSDTVAKQPRNARAHNNLAWALHEGGRPEEANRHYARATELNPTYVPARYNWGVALLAQQRDAESVTQLETAVRLAPEHVDARINLGNALLRTGRTDEAINQYEAALRLDPSADAHYNLGVAWLAHGSEAQAANAFAAALQRDPSLPDVQYQLGRIAERQGRLAEAETRYSETLKLSPAHVAAHARLGLLCARSDRLDAAVEHFSAVLRLQPDDADAHANLGNVRLLQNQPKAAIESYERALRLRPNDARTRENIELAREALR